MSKNAWGYLFAGVSALAGIVYLWQAHNTPAQQPVTNLFPPLNTNDGANTDAEGLPVGSADTSGINQAVLGPTPYPVFLV